MSILQAVQILQGRMVIPSTPYLFQRGWRCGRWLSDKISPGGTFGPCSGTFKVHYAASPFGMGLATSSTGGVNMINMFAAAWIFIATSLAPMVTYEYT